MKRDNIVAVTMIAALSLAVMYRQLVTPAVFSAVYDDTVVYLNWTRQFAESFREGVLYPRWMPDSNGGYGEPTFIFYQPLVIYLTALLDLAIRDTVLSVALVKLAGLFMSGIFMYIFVKGLWGHRAGLIAATVYTALPFRVFDLYLLGVHSSRFAFVWFPLVLHFARGAVMEERMGKNTAMLAVCYALLAITHLFSAYMFAPVLLGFGLVIAREKRVGHAALRLAAAALLGLMLDGFYLLPVLLERGLVHFEAMRTSWWSDYRNNFMFYIPAPGGRPHNPFYIYLGRTIIISALSGLLFYISFISFKEKRRSAQPAFFLAVTAVSLFLMTSLSAPVWEAVPGMKLLSFPSRWASITTFGLSLIAVAGVHDTEFDGSGLKRLPWIGRVFLLLAAVLLVLYCDVDIIKRGQTFTVQDIKESPKDLDLKEYLPKTVSLYWLRDQLKKPPAEKVAPLSGNPDSISILKWGAAERVFYVSGSRDTGLRVRTFYYPGWRASIDGKAVELASEEGSGAILLNVPVGRHEVALCFSDTPDRVWGKVISALAAAFVLYIFVHSGGKSCYNCDEMSGIAS